LSVSKYVLGNIAMERFNFELLNSVEVEEQVHIEISNRFAVLEIFSDSRDTWESIRGSIRFLAKLLSYCRVS
jgi:hypothetical protein